MKKEELRELIEKAIEENDVFGILHLIEAVIYDSSMQKAASELNAEFVSNSKPNN